MDIKINTELDKFKYRVCGILKHNNKYLGVKIADNEFYCLPGGHVEIGEDSEVAAKREMKEELGFEIKLIKLACIGQNLFPAKNNGVFHEIGFYYVVEAEDKTKVNPNDYEIVENDKGELKTLKFKWFTKEEIEKADFRPNFVKDMLNDNELIHVISHKNVVTKIERYTKQ